MSFAAGVSMADLRAKVRRGAWLALPLLVACGSSGDPARPEPPVAVADPSLGPGGSVRLDAAGWIDQDGRPFAPADLRGHVWVVALMFASCPMACPVMARRLEYLQTVLPAQVPSIRFMSITQDPENDTPAILAAYGRRFHRDPALWTFVTGDTDPAAAAIEAGFPRAPGARRAFDHGDTLVLVDGEGRVLGYYGKDDGGVARLVADAARVAGDGAPALR